MELGPRDANGNSLFRRMHDGFNGVGEDDGEVRTGNAMILGPNYCLARPLIDVDARGLPVTRRLSMSGHTTAAKTSGRPRPRRIRS